MRPRSRVSENYEELNVWPSFTDLIANAFMILSVLLLLALFKSLFLQSTAQEAQLDLSTSEQQVRALQNRLAALENQLAQRQNRVRQLQTQLRSNQSQVSQLSQQVERLKLAPPVVVIQDSGEYQFDSGSANLPQGLRRYIETDLVDKIEQITANRNVYIVEIIGHTDGQVNFRAPSNLDQVLEDVALGKKPVNNLNPGSNADLGLMRALEVVKQLQAAQKKGRLKGLEFRAYSAAQLILPSGKFASANRNPDRNRRRIEIRFSPLGKAETVR